MNIQPKDIEIFIHIADDKSFTRVSEKLYIAQPALSKTIQKMEKELNMQLLDRSRRDIRLTDAGKVVYEKGKEIIAKYSSMQNELNNLSDLVTGEIKVGLPQIIGTCFFPKIIKAFKKIYPGVTFEMIEEGGVIVERLVERGDLDIGFVVLPVQSKGVAFTEIYRDQFVLCVDKDHPLSRRKQVSLNDVKNESFIMFAKSFTLHNLILDTCRQSGFDPLVAYESSQWDLMIELVSEQQGVALIPRLLANKLNGVNTLSLSVKDINTAWRIGMIIGKGGYQSLALKEFVKVVEDLYL